MLTVIIKRAGKAPEVAEIENNLRAFQTIVGGYVEAVQKADGSVIWCNDEGLIANLPPNVMVDGHGFYGDLVIGAVDRRGENVSLTDAQVARWLECLS